MNHNDDPTMAPGHDNTQVLGLDFHNPVFPLSALVVMCVGLAKSLRQEHRDLVLAGAT